MIEPVNAYKISSGACYTDNVEAYRAEITELCRRLQKAGQMKFTSDLKEFGKVVDVVETWAKDAQALLAQIEKESESVKVALKQR